MEAASASNLGAPEFPRARSLSQQAATLFLSVALPFGVLLCLLTPPFEAPDEPQHFFRAYAISEGSLFAEPISGIGGGDIPHSVYAIASTLADGIPFHPHRKVEVQAIRAALSRPLRAQDRAEIQFPGSAVYFPAIYAPQTTGILVGRLFGAGPLVLMYLARLFGALGAIALVLLALRITPTHAMSFALFALLPMNAFVRSSVSADAVTIGVAMVFVAWILRLAAEPANSLPLRKLVTLVALGALVALTKQTYGILGLLFFLIPREKIGSWKRYLGLAALLLSVMLLVSGIWSLCVAHLFRPLAPGMGPALQGRWIVAHPLDAIATILRTLWKLRVPYLSQAIGRMGWLDTPIPSWSVWTLSILLAASALLDQGSWKSRLTDRVLLFGVFAAGAVAILMILFLTWTPVGGRIVEGVQGRYFLPLVPVLLLAAANHRLGKMIPVRVRRGLQISFVALSVVVTSTTLLSRYYLP